MTKEELLKEIEIKCFNKAGKFDGNFHNPKSKSHIPEIIQELEKHTSFISNTSLREQIYILRNNLTERPKCYCGNELPFDGFVKGYKQYCSGICQRKSPTKKEKVDNTWLNKTKEEKDEHVRKNKESKLRNHGNPNYNNSTKISETYQLKDQEYWDTRNEKQFNTKLERYGDKHYCNGDKISETWSNFTEEQREKIRLKKIETSLEKYGTQFPSQSEVIKNKQKETIFERYGVEHQMYSQKIKDKVQQIKTTNGTLQNNPNIIDKAKQTNIEKYGAITFTSSPEGKEQVIKTSLERYGVSNHMKTAESKQKIKDNWNDKTLESIEEITKQRKETCLKKYGVDSYAKSNIRRHLYFSNTYTEYLKRYNDINIEIIQTEEEYIKLRSENKFTPVKMKCKLCQNEWEERLHNNGSTAICRICNPYKYTKEREIGEFLETYGVTVKYKDRYTLYPLEIDVLLEEYKIGIEFNGLMFHSFGKSSHSMFNTYEFESEKKHNHLIKTKMMEEKGYQLFHINEDEWDDKNKQDIWKSLILNKLGLNERIFARKCYIQEIESSIARDFLNENHLQGYVNAEIKIGLFYNEDLISVMTFSKPRYNKEVEYELIRFASKKYYNIIGGASKILKYFERKYKPKSLLSYANRRWSIGNLYNKLEFKFIENTNPNYFYFNNTNKLESRLKFQKHKLKDLLEIFDDKLTESENMYNNNYRKIYDSGNIKFIKEYNGIC